MEMKLQDVSLLVTTTAAGLMAGLFYAYSISVVPGLGKLNDVEYLKAMQSINRAILNPLFFICFMGILLALPATSFIQYKLNRKLFTLMLAATIVYIVGVFGTTMFINVPLNNSLEKFSIDSSTAGNITLQRQQFEAKWNLWNNVRTIASLTAFIITVIACLNNSDHD